MPGSSYLVHTNILLRLVQPDSPEYGTIRQCTNRLWAQGADLFSRLKIWLNSGTSVLDRLIGTGSDSLLQRRMNAQL